MKKEKKLVTYKELKKHVAIIHCANSFSLLQRKISNALLHHAFPQLMEKEEHEISVRQLCNIIGYSGNNYDVIKESLKQLIATIIEWNVTDENGEEDWTASSILASVQLKGAVCNYSYSPRLRRLLANPKMFGKINLAIQAQFSSSYGLALYENCVRFNRLPYTKWFDLDAFRKIMGVPPGKYKIYRDFKKRVIDKAVEEVNNLSDMLIEPEYNKVNRQVVSIRFKLKEKEQFSVPEIKMEEGRAVEVADTTLELLVNTYGITEKLAIQLHDEYGADTIQEKIKFIKASQSYKAGNIKSMAAYLTKALQENYKSNLIPWQENEGNAKVSQKNDEARAAKKESLLVLKKQQQELYVACANKILLKEKYLINEQIKIISEKISMLEREIV